MYVRFISYKLQSIQRESGKQLFYYYVPGKRSSGKWFVRKSADPKQTIINIVARF